MFVVINLWRNIVEKLTIEEFFADFADDDIKKEIFEFQTVRQVFKFLKLKSGFRLQIESDAELATEVRVLVKKQEAIEEKKLRRSVEFNRKELKSPENFEGFKHLLFKVNGFKDSLSDEVIKEIFDFKDKGEK